MTKDGNFLIESEHGPRGGDELNVVNLSSEVDLNYGWPISSYGDPYPGTEKIFEKNGWLKKSHKENNFIEPLKYFKPSIGISEIIFKSVFPKTGHWKATGRFFVQF